MKNANCFNSRSNMTGVTGCYAGRLLIALVLVCTAVTAYADNRRDSGRQQQTQARQQQGISAGQAAAIAKNQYGGEVLKVERAGNRYRVKLLLPSGTVKTVYIAAE
jgi:uncharacterized membrane protein YkoI